jgi:sulfur-carrier protein
MVQIVVQIVVPSLLAAQAGGRQRFDVEAETVGEALRALPVADLLFNERGEWSRHLNVFVDGRDARDQGGPACPLAGAREVLIVAMLSGG